MKRNTAIGIGVVVLAALALFWFTRGGGDKKDDNNDAKVTKTKKSKKKGKRVVRSNKAGSDFRSSVISEDDPIGSLRLEGQVVDADGHGVGGAQVTIDSMPPKVVKTEKDGSFGIDKLVARPYRLVARAKEGVAGPVVARLNEKNDPIILKLKAASSVQFTIIDAMEKKPVKGATVELRGMDKQTATTGEDGVAVVTNVVPGWYNAVAYAPKFARQHTWFRVDGKHEVTLELRQGAPVSGIVVTPDGKPLANAAVLYEGASSWAQQANPRWDAATTDEKGKFKFDGLPPGSFRFVARHKKFAPGKTKLIVLDGKNPRTKLKISMEEPAVLFGVVMSKDKEAVPSARIRVGVKVEGMDWSRPRQTYADDLGKFEIGALPRKKLQIVALHENGSSEIIELDMTAAPFKREQDLTLDLTLRIAGQVVDSKGEPVEGAQVWASAKERRRGRRGSWRLRGANRELTNANGEFSIGSLRKGEYSVRANPPGASNAGWGGMGWYRKGTDAKAGDENVKVVLEADAGVKGKVAFKNGDNPKFFTVGIGFRTRKPFASKDGKFEMKDLPPNDYTLTIRGPFDTTSQKVTVKAGEMKDLGTITVRKGRTISGVVLADGRPVSGATVRVGSIIFGDGSSSKAAFTPPFARGTKETTTDEEGAFMIYGAVLGDVSLVAEHEAHGRSQSVAIRKTRASQNNIQLLLKPFGALEGRVTRNGAPVTKVFVSAQSQSVPAARFGVMTDTDGKFRLDRLAPDTYQVTAMDMGNGGMRGGMGTYSNVATVKSGETASTEIKFEGGSLNIEVKLKATDGKMINFAMIRAAAGRIAPKTNRELDLIIAAMNSGYSGWGMSFAGMAANFKGLAAGTYTVCAAPSPNEVTGMAQGMAYLEREGANLAVFCKTVALTDALQDNKVELTVETPKFVPPPADEPPTN